MISKIVFGAGLLAVIALNIWSYTAAGSWLGVGFTVLLALGGAFEVYRGRRSEEQRSTALVAFALVAPQLGLWVGARHADRASECRAELAELAERHPGPR